MFWWAHDYARPVIGRAVEVWQEPHRLLAKMNFAPTEFAQEVAMLYRTGYQKGVSVGFKPLRYEERRDEKTGAFLGIRFLEQDRWRPARFPFRQIETPYDVLWTKLLWWVSTCAWSTPSEMQPMLHQAT